MNAKWMAPLAAILALLLVAVGPVPGATDQTAPVRHEVGQAWIQKDAIVSTRVHLPSDEICFVEFEDRCYGGMMAPDSVLCVLETLPEIEWPDECLIAVGCDITDPDGGHMFDGSGMHQSMMQREAVVTVHYSETTMAQLGFGHEDLCLVRIGSAGTEVCDQALQDAQASTFTLRTTTPTASFAVVPRSSLVDTEFRSLGSLKSQF